ncbi:MAG: restriction endonuclease subunit S [Fibrobacter sp.]|nr:restriction endonuclease subunit S [Fibrobacter sp.]
MKTGWKFVKLGDVCEIYQPKTISSELLVADGAYLVYGANGVIGRYNKYNHEESEVLLTCRGATCGTINVSKPKSWINGNAMVIHPKDRFVLTPDFLYYALKSLDYSIIITGAAQPQITRQSLVSIPIPLPPMAEQQAIVAELDALNSIIAKKQQQLAELDRLAQATFYDMFGDPVNNDKGWNVKKLGEVCDVVTGSTPRTNIDAYWKGGTKLWITPAELKGQLYITDTERKITDSAVSNTKLTLMPIGTVLLSSRAPIGKVAIAAKEMYCNQGFKNLVCKGDINNLYLYCFLMLQKDYLISLGRGATFKEISKSIVEKVEIPLPPLALQQSFAERMEAIERQKELVKQSIAEAQTLLNATMDKYFG